MGTKVVALSLKAPAGVGATRIFERTPVWIGGSETDDLVVPDLPDRLVSIEFDDDGASLTVHRPSTAVAIDDVVVTSGTQKSILVRSRVAIGSHSLTVRHQSFSEAMADRFGPSSPVPQERDDFPRSAPLNAVSLATRPPSAPFPAPLPRTQRLADLDATQIEPVAELDPPGNDHVEAAVSHQDPIEDVPAFTPNVGTTLAGRYELSDRLGAGGMGTVFEAKDKRFAEAPPVAVKVLNASFANSAEAHARFKREADISSRLRGHDGIAKIYDYGVDRGVPYIVMELLKGQDFAARWLDDTISREDSLDVILQTCAAVFAAHEKGVIHRDLKPQNVFVTEGRLGLKVKILDFGISVGASLPTLTKPGMVVGTWEYLAAEVASGQAATEYSDQYAIGVILYQVLVGRLPFSASDPVTLFRCIAEGKFPKPRDLVPDLSPDLEKIVLKAMALSPNDRFASVQALGAALLPHVAVDAQRTWSNYFTTSNPNALYSVPTKRPASTSVKQTKLLDGPAEGELGRLPKQRRQADKRDQRLVLILVAVALAIFGLTVAVKVLLGRD